ncbi:MAG: efflux RND transporter periplasmic adaptor subunit [Planctomycetales bacterium]|jgi:biotin carboxyl carrier protein
MFQQLRQLVIPALILAGGAGGLFWLSAMNEPPTRIAVPSQPPLVETRLAEAHADSFPIRVNGVVVPYREIRISAEVDGRIVMKAEGLRSGKIVSAGTPLMTIDPEPFELELEKLTLEDKQASIEQQQISIESKQIATLISLVEKRLELATREFTRSEKLTATNASSQAERDLAERTVLEVQDALELLQNRRELLPLREAGLQTKSDLISSRRKGAALDLSRTEIIAPLVAIVTKDLQEVGSFVERGDHLLTLQDPSRFEVDCRLCSEDLYWLQDSAGLKPDANAADTSTIEAAALKAAFELPEVDAAVTFKTSGESFTWQGRLARSDGSGYDATTRTLACRVVVEQPVRSADAGPPALIAGMFVEVVINVRPRTALLAIPRGALQPDGQVWVIDDGKLIVHRVRPARVTDSVVLLRADRTGIASGSHVVVSTLPIAFDGMDVRERSAP